MGSIYDLIFDDQGFTSPRIEVGFIRLRQIKIPNSGKPELGER